jgi:hypothetical protein
MDTQATCATCPWWLSEHKAFGQCRRFPPRDSVFAAWFGRTANYRATDWCGEHPARQSLRSPPYPRR